MLKKILALAMCFAITATGCTTAAGSEAQKSNLTPGNPTSLPNTATVAPISTQDYQNQPEPLEFPTPTHTQPPLAETEAPAIASTATALPGAIDWRELPVVPEPGPRVLEIYQRGLALGNNPAAFSKIGDCGSTPAWFLGDFDRGPRYYRLGEYQSLENVIAAYKGSFARTSLAAKSGFNASSIFSPLWSNPKLCQSNETPLACEYRVHRPIMAFIMLGSNDVYHPDEFESQMRRIIEYSIDQGVIPILSTKADNIEGDGSINATIARLANEYGVPLLNYWRALQELPDKGLQDDMVHITWGSNKFDDPLTMQRGWPVRNLTALQTLNEVWQAVTGSSPAP